MKKLNSFFSMAKRIQFLLGMLFLVSIWSESSAQSLSVSVRIDDDIRYQKITGFGGFVCSPQFAYDYMSTSEIEQLWGGNSEMGYNIMRLYIPIGKESWSQSLATAQLAQSLDLIIFASPWSMPAEWKTNNNIAGVVISGNEEKEGFLKEEHYEDYANYLNDYVTYLRDNGVELAGISLQNEPDYKVEYAGCTWTPQQIINFVNNYRDIIDCPIIAPETVGFSNNYINPILDSEAFDKIDIYAGHQYGNIQGDLQKVYETGKDIWMTEYLINWNAGQSTPRDYSWELDAFDFAGQLNQAMLANVNAWIHYASKRYYAMMGDGTNGTTAGEITKRGYILSHFAQYTTGTTRIDSDWKDDANQLDGSSYISVSGDSVILQVINPADEGYQLTVDLPFYTELGTTIVTTGELSMSESSVDLEEETFRPKVDIAASSFATLIFVKSKDREVSLMTGEPVYFNKIEEQTVTNPAFGNGYQLSGQTITFDVNNQLISSNQDASNGYLQLDEKYSKMVFQVNSASSANQNNSDNTTLYYVNATGEVSSHNYGPIDIDPTGSFDWVFDISSEVLPDGCTGIIGISNSNYSSVLTMEFGEVYFLRGNEKSFKFSGDYSGDDSNLLDCLGDVTYTSLDFTAVTGIAADENWHEAAANKNSLFYVNDDVANSNPNVIAGTTCAQLNLVDGSGELYVPESFTAEAATFSTTLDNYRLYVLPFETTVLSEVKVFQLEPSANEINCKRITDGEIPANKPVLVVGNGDVQFEGSGSVSSPQQIVNGFSTVYSFKQVPATGYYLRARNGVAGFYPVDDNEVTIEPYGAYFSEENDASVNSLPLTFSDEPQVTVNFDVNGGSTVEAISSDFFSTITKPANPTKPDYAFVGWFSDPELLDPWDFEQDLVTEEITLYAKWELAEYLVTFETNGGSEIAPIATTFESFIEVPADPVREGYVFAGWFIDPELTEVWDFESDQVTGDMTLYAKWELILGLGPSADFIIYPTLVSEELNIGMNMSSGTGYIYDINGSLVIKAFKVSRLTSVDVSSLKSGLYVIKVVGSEKQRIGRFIKE